MTNDVLLTNGDSWTFGSEIIAPEFLDDIKRKGGNASYINVSPQNDYYRIPRTWSYTVSKNLNKK